MTFKDLGFSEKLLQAIDEVGYTDPTPIQAQAIPHVLMMRDVVGVAQTGTGKTASFTLPMIEILHGGRAKARMPRSLILTPTRELAAQIAENFDLYGKYTKLDMALLTGGVSMNDQIKKLERGVDVLIATPGRLLDLFERGQILLTDIKILVIDEADRMMDMGFIPDIEKIVSKLPFTRQTLLFSATMPPEIRKLTEKFLSSPREVKVESESWASKNVEQFLVWTDKRRKMDTLATLIKDEKVQNAFVFCNRKKDISGVRKFLEKAGHGVGEIHGDMDQTSRTATLEKFKNNEITLLVCSDVVARGIDINNVSHVFNYDVPMNAEDYVHRIGRTGRAGKEGRAWSLASKGAVSRGRTDEDFVGAIEKLIDQKIEVVDVKGGGSGSSSGGAGRGDRKPRGESSKKDQTRHKKPRSAEQAERQPRREQNDRSERLKPSREKSPRPKRDDNAEDNSGVVGFGDDAPSFFG